MNSGSRPNRVANAEVSGCSRRGTHVSVGGKGGYCGSVAGMLPSVMSLYCGPDGWKLKSPCFGF